MENYPDIMFAGTLISCVFSCVQIMFRSSGLEILYKSSIWNNTDKIMGREFFRIDFDYLQFVFLQSFGIIESTNNDRQRIEMNTMRKRKDADYRNWLMKMALIFSAASVKRIKKSAKPILRFTLHHKNRVQSYSTI